VGDVREKQMVQYEDRWICEKNDTNNKLLPCSFGKKDGCKNENASPYFLHTLL
jgi:hypothetical protein